MKTKVSIIRVILSIQPIRKALKTPEFVLSEANYCRTKKGFEASDRFQGVVRTTDINVSFPTTPALLMLIFCRNVLQGCRNNMATNT